MFELQSMLYCQIMSFPGMETCSSQSTLHSKGGRERKISEKQMITEVRMSNKASDGRGAAEKLQVIEIL